MLVARGKLERLQAILEVGVQKFIPQPTALDNQDPSIAMPVNTYRALLDTGAQRTCLTNNTIASEGLVRHGHKFIRNVHDEATHSLFMSNIGIWSDGLDMGQNGEPTRSHFLIDRPVEVINIENNSNFDAILGMDVLCAFSFKFEKGGEFEVELN